MEHFVYVLQALEKVKLVQIEKFHKAKSDFERDSIELDPIKILHVAVENCKPLLITKRVHRGAVVYQVFCLTHEYAIKLCSLASI